MKSLRERLKVASIDEIHAKIDKLVSGERELRKMLETFQSRGLSATADEFLGKAITLKTGRLVLGICDSTAEGMKTLRNLNEKILAKFPDSIAVIGMEESGTERPH